MKNIPERIDRLEKRDKQMRKALLILLEIDIKRDPMIRKLLFALDIDITLKEK